MTECLKDTINQSKAILMEYWPLQAFIATNPLWDLRHQSFFEIVSKTQVCGLMPMDYYHEKLKSRMITQNDLSTAIEVVKQELTSKNHSQHTNATLFKDHSEKLLFATQIDEFNFQKPIIWIKERIYIFLRDYFGNQHYKDETLFSYWLQNKMIHIDTLDDLPDQSINDAIIRILVLMNIPAKRIPAYLETIYTELYGWGSLMKWRDSHPENPWLPGDDPCEVLLLMWLYYEYHIMLHDELTYQDPMEKLDTALPNNHRTAYIWQTALELNYIRQLDDSLNHNPHDSHTHNYDAQFIFCIDTRSEGLRRHIEAQGNYQTYGFAGFFGSSFKMNNDSMTTYQSPALVKPHCSISGNYKKSWLKTVADQFKLILYHTKKQIGAPFALFEILGLWHLIFMLYKNLRPLIRIKHDNTQFTYQCSLSEDEQVSSAINLLKTIGLIDGFANTILICAHQSDNANNPFKSSLDCGACGGNSGIPNAVIMCDILNNVRIRSRLKLYDIDIPTDSTFIPACHHTAFDRVEIIKGAVPNTLQKALETASKQLRNEKIKTLPGRSPLSQREQSWSELIPELGLINNAAIIVGPRTISQKCDLQRRVFLHSYDPNLDKDASILTSILSAPVIVAHWISSQYYFSTVHPDLFGAGNKAIHNVLPGIGVLEGNLSDLKVGLPNQSFSFQSTTLHEPRRLTVIVYAHQTTLDTAIKKSPDFKQLLENHWIHLKHIPANNLPPLQGKTI